MGQLSKSMFRTIVNNAVTASSFQDLKIECASLKKTAELSYESFELQDYLKVLYPNQARIILKGRCKTLDLKTHNTYLYKEDKMCRGCDEQEETFEHVLNCGQVDSLDLDIFQIGTASDLNCSNLIQAANRISAFKEMCDDKAQNRKQKSQPTQQSEVGGYK